MFTSACTLQSADEGSQVNLQGTDVRIQALDSSRIGRGASPPPLHLGEGCKRCAGVLTQLFRAHTALAKDSRSVPRSRASGVLS